jgi:hypothetical protein
MTPRFQHLSAAWLLLALTACSPKATPPAPDPEVREIEEREANRDRDRIGPLGVPEKELPQPDQCRLWHPGRPSAEQPKPQQCGDAEAKAPAGTWVLYRPKDDTLVVHARVIHPERDGEVVRINIYDAEKGTYMGTKEVKEEVPGEE